MKIRSKAPSRCSIHAAGLDAVITEQDVTKQVRLLAKIPVGLHHAASGTPENEFEGVNRTGSTQPVASRNKASAAASVNRTGLPPAVGSTIAIFASLP